MTIAIMQPYIFPYIGYFQMIQAVDKFVFYDDVNFIKRGWINRNKILNNGKELLFTVPLVKPSQNRLIHKTLINQELYEGWRNNFFQTLNQAYGKAPFYQQVLSLLKKVLNNQYNTISELAIKSCEEISGYLGLKPVFAVSSREYDNRLLERQERILDICKQENAKTYINAPGGMELYSKEDFEEQDIRLKFIKPKIETYKQFNNEFVPGLSIIDVMMFNSVEKIKEDLNKYELL